MKKYIIIFALFLTSCTYNQVREKATQPLLIEISLKNDTIAMQQRDIESLLNSIEKLTKAIEMQQQQIEMKEKVIIGLDKYNLLHYKTFGN